MTRSHDPDRKDVLFSRLGNVYNLVMMLVDTWNTLDTVEYDLCACIRSMVLFIYSSLNLGIFDRSRDSVVTSDPVHF